MIFVPVSAERNQRFVNHLGMRRFSLDKKIRIICDRLLRGTWVMQDSVQHGMRNGLFGLRNNCFVSCNILKYAARARVKLL